MNDREVEESLARRPSWPPSRGELKNREQEFDEAAKEAEPVMETGLRLRIRQALRKPDCAHVHTSYPEADINVLAEAFAQWLDDLAAQTEQSDTEDRDYRIALRHAAAKAREDAGSIRTVLFGDVT